MRIFGAILASVKNRSVDVWGEALDSTSVGSGTPFPDQAPEAMIADTESPDVEIYTTPTCPDCHQLKAWLTLNGVPFTERDLTDPAVAEEAKARTGVRVAPITCHLQANSFKAACDALSQRANPKVGAIACPAIRPVRLR